MRLILKEQVTQNKYFFYVFARLMKKKNIFRVCGEHIITIKYNVLLMTNTFNSTVTDVTRFIILQNYSSMVPSLKELLSISRCLT